MADITQTYVIYAPPEEVWRALTDPELIEVWSSAPATFLPEAGADYSLWGGDVGGTVQEAVPSERLVQTWKPKDWTIEDSIVTFVLSPEDGGTRVDLVHENVQDWDFEGTTEGWDIYYLGPIKKMLEARSTREPAAPKRSAPKKATAKKSAAKKKGGAKKSSSKKSAKKSAKKSTKKSSRKSSRST